MVIDRALAFPWAHRAFQLQLRVRVNDYKVIEGHDVGVVVDGFSIDLDELFEFGPALFLAWWGDLALDVQTSTQPAMADEILTDEDITRRGAIIVLQLPEESVPFVSNLKYT